MLETYLRECTERDWMRGDVSGTVRFAMVGVGWWAQEEAIPAVAASEWCETTTVVDSSTEKTESVIESRETVEHGLTYEEYENGVASDAYDAVYICTPNGVHLDHVKPAAEQGKAILCEKPMEKSVDRARELVDVCDREDVTLMIAYRMQTEPLVRRAKELLDDGVVGKPIQIHSDDSATLLDIFPDEDQWRLDAELAGGCALIDLGIYPINTIRFLLGADPELVTGATWNTHEAFADVDENVRFALQFPDDIGAVCTASHRAHGTSNLRIIGRDGLIELRDIYHPWADRELIVEVGDARARISPDDVNQMIEEFDYFAHCLLTDTDPYPDGRHGLRDMEIISQVYDAAADSRVREVSDI